MDASQICSPVLNSGRPRNKDREKKKKMPRGALGPDRKWSRWHFLRTITVLFSHGGELVTAASVPGKQQQEGEEGEQWEGWRDGEAGGFLGKERKKNDDGGDADINVKNGRSPGGEEERGATNCTVLSGSCGLVGEAGGGGEGEGGHGREKKG